MAETSCPLLTLIHVGVSSVCPGIGGHEVGGRHQALWPSACGRRRGVGPARARYSRRRYCRARASMEVHGWSAASSAKACPDSSASRPSRSSRSFVLKCPGRTSELAHPRSNLAPVDSRRTLHCIDESERIAVCGRHGPAVLRNVGVAARTGAHRMATQRARPAGQLAHRCARRRGGGDLAAACRTRRRHGAVDDACRLGRRTTRRVAGRGAICRRRHGADRRTPTSYPTYAACARRCLAAG
jgi:hypothetical protein